MINIDEKENGSLIPTVALPKGQCDNNKHKRYDDGDPWWQTLNEQHLITSYGTSVCGG